MTSHGKKFKSKFYFDSFSFFIRSSQIGKGLYLIYSKKIKKSKDVISTSFYLVATFFFLLTTTTMTIMRVIRTTPPPIAT